MGRIVMKLFFISLADGHLSSDVIRADDEGAAKIFMKAGEITVTEIAANVATPMAVTEERGRHEGALFRWLIGNTNILGDLLE
jgi:hypothetical protein